MKSPAHHQPRDDGDRAMEALSNAIAADPDVRRKRLKKSKHLASPRPGGEP